MHPRLPLFAVATIALAAAACDAGGSGPPVSYCRTTADCPRAMVCEFSATEGCGAQGECAAQADAQCGAQPVCSCAGATVNACVVNGYAVGSPVRGVGACEGGS